MIKRIVSAAILAPLITYLVIWAPFWAFLLVLAIVAGLCFYEYHGIVEAHGIEGPGIFGFAAGYALFAACFTPRQTEVALLALIALGALTLAAFATTELSRCLPRAGALALGVMYIFGGWRCAIPLRAVSPHWLFFALALNWVGDTAAMYTGRQFGRHKLAPELSPKKSWEGSAGSVIASVLFGLLYLPRAIGVPYWEVALVAVLANVAGQVGDLCESALKRGAEMKDSGTLLPGHGGWLDRVDSSLFAVPVVYAWVALRAG